MAVVVTASSSCVVEFDKCVTNRDCCDDLECVTGDWQYTTDSTCLSQKSQHMDVQTKGLTLEEKTALVEEFYSSLSYKEDEETTKTKEEITKIAHKYRHEFPKLVQKLERKYSTSFPDFDKSLKMQLQTKVASSPSTNEEL
jgi:hypothetical protein